MQERFAFAKTGLTVSLLTILIATGLHRGATDDEIRTIAGQEIAARYRVVNQDARILSRFSDLSEAIDRFLDDLPTGASVALIPEGPYSFARVTG